MSALRKLCFHFLKNRMGYGRDDSFPFDFVPNGFDFVPTFGAIYMILYALFHPRNVAVILYHGGSEMSMSVIAEN